MNKHLIATFCCILIPISSAQGVEIEILRQEGANQFFHDTGATFSQPKIHPIKPESPIKNIVIMLDPGHGGKDGGAQGEKGTQEKQINLTITRKLSESLKTHGFTVLQTRDKDTHISLLDRSKAANEKKVDLFLSIHCNATESGKDSGIEIYSLPESIQDPSKFKACEEDNRTLDPPAVSVRPKLVQEGMALNTRIAGSIKKHTGLKSIYVKQSPFFVLRCTHAPSVLMEIGFLSNSRDENRLLRADFQEKLVDSISTGIQTYLKEAIGPMVR